MLQRSIQMNNTFTEPQKASLLNMLESFKLPQVTQDELAVFLNPDTRTSQLTFSFHHDLNLALAHNDTNKIYQIFKLGRSSFIELYNNKDLSNKEYQTVHETFSHDFSTLRVLENRCKETESVYNIDNYKMQFNTCSQRICIREASLNIKPLELPSKYTYDGTECFDRLHLLHGLVTSEPGKGINPNNGYPFS